MDTVFWSARGCMREMQDEGYGSMTEPLVNPDPDTGSDEPWMALMNLAPDLPYPVPVDVDYPGQCIAACNVNRATVQDVNQLRAVLVRRKQVVREILQVHTALARRVVLCGVWQVLVLVGATFVASACWAFYTYSPPAGANTPRTGSALCWALDCPPGTVRLNETACLPTGQSPVWVRHAGCHAVTGTVGVLMCLAGLVALVGLVHLCLDGLGCLRWNQRACGGCEHGATQALRAEAALAGRFQADSIADAHVLSATARQWTPFLDAVNPGAGGARFFTESYQQCRRRALAEAEASTASRSALSGDECCACATCLYCCCLCCP
jgi:hypothetical protein